MTSLRDWAATRLRVRYGLDSACARTLVSWAAAAPDLRAVAGLWNEPAAALDRILCAIGENLDHYVEGWLASGCPELEDGMRAEKQRQPFVTTTTH